MSKKMFLALRLHNGEIEIDKKIETKIQMPIGCVGVCFVFETERDAKDYWGENIELVEIAFVKDI